MQTHTHIAYLFFKLCNLAGGWRWWRCGAAALRRSGIFNAGTEPFGEEMMETEDENHHEEYYNDYHIKETEREKKLMIKSRLVLWVTEWGGDDLHEMCRNLIEEGLREEQRDWFHCEAERNWKKCLIGNWLRNAKGEWE